MRLFVAFEVPPAAAAALDRRIAAERDALPPARWVDPGNLHLTLLFLGAVEQVAVAGLATALRPVFAAHPPLTLRLAGAGCFPPPVAARPRPARVAWVGVEVAEGLRCLVAVQAAVERAARGVLDLPVETRPWAPHLTLARPRPPWPPAAAAAFTAAFAPPAGGPFRVVAGALVASEPGRGAGGGSLYRAIDRFPLAAAEAVA